jgi:hypothetical protein
LKRKALLYTLLAGMATLIFSSYGNGPYAGGAGNRTGSAGSTADCTGSNCHSANSSTTIASIALFDNGAPVTTYTPGKTYTVRVSASVIGTSRPRFGFQASCVKAADGSTQAGTFSAGATYGIAVRSSTPRLVEHTTPLAGSLFSGNYIDTVSFSWTAPATGFGKVRFYAVVNAVNFNGTSSGDAPNATTTEYDPAPVGVSNVNEQLAGIYPNPVSNTLHLRLKGQALSAIVTDLNGKLFSLPAPATTAGEISLDVSRLSAGYYHLSVLVDGKAYSAPFVKN